MIRKAVLILVTFTIARMIVACCEREFYTLLINYNGFELKGVDIGGFHWREVEDSVSRLSFGIMVTILSETELISQGKYSGYSAAYALQCHDEYVYIADDQVAELNIFLIDAENPDTEINVNAAFMAETPNQQYSMEEYVQLDHNYWFNFNLRMLRANDTPSLTRFRLEGTLESGRLISGTTDWIRFY
jgi:hypothetical protein